jgi:cytochrome c
MKSAIVLVSALAFAFVAGSLPVSAEGDPKRGAKTYRACVSCHALAPGLHLSGPSLGGIMGRTAGTAKDYGRYSKGLKAAGFAWTEATLDQWLENPRAMIPDTSMTFAGIRDAQARADLMAFLQIAGKAGGGEQAVADGLIPAEWLRGAAPDPIRDAPPEARVAEIRHCGDSFFIKTEAGAVTPFWEKNVRLKIDSVETGPPPGVPVILGAGMGGDRVSVIFASLADLQSFVKEQC